MGDVVSEFEIKINLPASMGLGVPEPVWGGWGVVASTRVIGAESVDGRVLVLGEGGSDWYAHKSISTFRVIEYGMITNWVLGSSYCFVRNYSWYRSLGRGQRKHSRAVVLAVGRTDSQLQQVLIPIEARSRRRNQICE